MVSSLAIDGDPSPPPPAMTSPARVMLISCGSYNPITNMHLRMFELGRDFLNGSGRYLVVGGIISPVNDAYGKKELAAAAHRCAMVQLAIRNTPWIRLDTWESDQDRWIETVKLLRHHYSVINDKQGANRILTPAKTKHVDQQNANITDSLSQSVEGHLELKLLCGADLLQSFAVPGLWREEDILEIVSRFGIVVVSRSGSSPEKFIYESDILSKHRNNICLVTEWIPNEICSTRIRRALRRSQSVKYLLQDSVINYIHQHQLFGVSDSLPSPGFSISDQTKVASEDATDSSKK